MSFFFLFGGSTGLSTTWRRIFFLFGCCCSRLTLQWFGLRWYLLGVANSISVSWRLRHLVHAHHQLIAVLLCLFARTNISLCGIPCFQPSILHYNVRGILHHLLNLTAALNSTLALLGYLPLLAWSDCWIPWWWILLWNRYKRYGDLRVWLGLRWSIDLRNLLLLRLSHRRRLFIPWKIRVCIWVLILDGS